MELLVKLKEEAEAASLAFSQAESKVFNEVNARRIEIQAAANAELEEMRNRLREENCWDALREAKNKADAALAAEKDRLARIGDGGPYPVGTKLYRWGPSSRYARDSVLTKEVGLFECVTGDSDHPGNMGDWSRAAVGTFIIRCLKKDGTPSAKYHKYHDWMSWYPEGESPTNNTRREKS